MRWVDEAIRRGGDWRQQFDAVDAAIDGLWRWILNSADAAEDLVLKSFSGATVATVNQNESAIVVHDKDDGWTLVALVAIALS